MANIVLKNICKEYSKNQPIIKDLNLEIEDGSFTVLLGASGCGKSTILRMVAGLEKETYGNIYIGDKDMKDVEPGDRNIAMVFQNYALYPTMTVRGNIEFGLKNMKVPKQEREEKIMEAVKIVGLQDFIDRKPQNLSGGQRQRVALARAIVKDPKVFLMDEPLSNLDAKLRTQIRTDLIELYQKLKTTFLYVTHDQVEAMSMATKIVLLYKGEVQQIGTPMEIYEKPKNVYTAKFIGSPPMNIIKKEKLDIAIKNIPQEAAFIGFRPEKALLEEDENCLRLDGEIITKELLGDQILYKIATDCGNINVKTFNKTAINEKRCVVFIKNEDLHFFDVNEMRIEN
ncbi:ATP-binding cassette domain-containing protein [uncultured Tyzzerella sp.]|uniref:ABC transporter ATP-binding protein n=1 Tax=uncultured Tyzzerella sp. TaxID=2321398 RepID=UPI0029421EED|nr:ATP-binding cassette domain-containing protein [uncultured Tyzzerella sp.]